jgi:hypothetical protein
MFYYTRTSLSNGTQEELRDFRLYCALTYAWVLRTCLNLEIL